MRRSLLTVVGVTALVLAVPSAALAHHGHHHHHKTKAHHAKFRIMNIGSPAVAPTTPTTSTAPTTQTTTPPPENAGTVASYTGGVLTLTLNVNDGTSVSGKVTNDTRIGCVKATPTPSAGSPPTDGGPGDDNGQGDDQSRGDMSQSGQGKDEWQGDHGSGGDDEEEEVQGTPEPPCDSSALVTGAIVRFAELRIGPGGTEFESILLVR